jgi:inorganic triphosphatase YgiF
VRHQGAKRLQTIKSGGSDSSFRRGEWEQEIKGDVPDLRKARDTALAPLLTEKLKRKLKPVFETHIYRTTVAVRKNGTLIEVAVRPPLSHGGALASVVRSRGVDVLVPEPI